MTLLEAGAAVVGPEDLDEVGVEPEDPLGSP
jgi:hypothetical protein